MESETNDFFEQLVEVQTSSSGRTTDDIITSCESIRRFLAYEVSAGRNQATDSRRKFYLIFPKLMDRIFGEDEAAKLKGGGWMSQSVGCPAERRSSRTQQLLSAAATTVGSSSSSSSRQNKGDKVDPNKLTGHGKAITKLLSNLLIDEGSLFQMLFSTSHPVELRLDLNLLPAPTQMAIRTQYDVIPFLYTHLLDKPLPKQALDPRSRFIVVSITEYYMFYFLRYPTRSRDLSSSSRGSFSSSNQIPRRTWSRFVADGMTALTKGNPYACLLMQYLDSFISSPPQRTSTLSVDTRTADKFFAMLIELWLHQNSVVYGMSSAQSRVVSSGQATLSNELPDALTPVHTMGEYIAPTSDVIYALMLTYIYLVNDSAMPIRHPVHSPQAGMSCLTERLQLLQRPLFSFFQVGLARCQIGVSPTSFLSLVDLWLAYVQPWICQEVFRAKDTPSPGSYTSDWEGYVLCNYHFYTTIFGRIIERLREIDFRNDVDAMLRVVNRTLGVYSNSLIQVLEQAQTALQEGQRGNPSTVGNSLMQFQLLQHHYSVLGVQLVPIPFASFRRDAERLHEELRTVEFSSKTNAATKEFVQRIVLRLREIFKIADGYGTSTRVPPQSIREQVNRVDTQQQLTPDRVKARNYALSPLGLQQIREGKRLCTTEHIGYIGDPMFQPVRSYEIRILVTFMVWLSNVLNSVFRFNVSSKYHEVEQRRRYQFHNRTRLGDIDLTTAMPQSFRFNLRFLASQGNFLVALTCVVIVYLFIF